MSMENIRQQYGVPAKVGMRVTAIGKPGVITGTRGPHLRIRIDGEIKPRSYHPTWKIEYPPSAA